MSLKQSESSTAAAHRSPWPKVLLTIAIGASSIIVAGRTAPFIDTNSILWACASPLLGLLLVTVSLCFTASSPFRALKAFGRLMTRWRSLPASSEPLAWTVLVCSAEEGLFRIAAFTFLPASWWVVIGVSVLFVAVHLPRVLKRRRPLRVAFASFLFSVLLCGALIATESFWLVALAHIIHNRLLDRVRETLALVRKTTESASTERASTD